MTTLVAGVLAQARRTPDAVAVRDGATVLDYTGLVARGGAVAAALYRHGIRPGDAVAVCLPRSWQLVCVMFGAARLGCTVVPLDAQSPPGRLRHMLTDSGARTLIGRSVDGWRSWSVDELLEPGPGPVDHPAPDVSFLFYTSGTTGQPKGVEVRDAGILRLAEPASGYPAFGPGDRFACLSNPAFDAISFEVWAPLLTGGCCVIVDDATAQAPDLLAAALLRDRVDVVFITVALFNAVVDKAPHCFAGAGRVLVGGEQLNAPLIRRWYRDNPDAATRLHNVYGPTETTTFALCHPVPRGFAGAVVPIGRPLAGTVAHLVVDGAAPAAPGEVAELYLGGAGVAAGYRNLPDETAARFVRLPWLDGGRDRLYRTGDLVRLDPAGEIEYVGRVDRQVKVRGFRVEPGELERQIVAHPAVRQAFVCTGRHPVYGTAELLAFLVLGADLPYGQFEAHVAATLPGYMRPHRVHLVDALPRNANGKVDQDALLALDLPVWRPDGTGGPAASDWEREVLAVAGEVLGLADPRLGDGWIASGGDSLTALRLRFEVRRRWGRELTAAQVLGSDLRSLAALIAADGAAPDPGPATGYPVPAPPAGARTAPATSEQERLWLLQQREPASRAYSVGFAFELTGTVDVAALRSALRGLVARHPALRTAFAATPDGLRQVVGDPYDPWTEPADDPPITEPFDLSTNRMLRATYLPDPGTLLLALHHIAVDGWSVTVLLRDLTALYAGTGTGAPPPTPLDFAVWQAEWFTRPAYRARRVAAVAAVDAPVSAPLRPVRSGGGAGLLRTTLDVVRRTALDRLCADLGLTRFPVLLALYAWSVYGVTGRARPRIASPVANRPVREFADSVGMFAGTVLLPLDLTGGDDLRAVLARVGGTVAAVLDAQDVALAHVVADHGPRPGAALFDFMFVLDNTDFGALALPGCAARPVWLPPPAPKCPLTLSVLDHDDGFDLLWEYAGDHFDAAGVRALADLFRAGLDRLVAAAPGTLADLVGPYRAALPEPGRGTVVPLTDATVAAEFERQVRATPHAPAVVAGGRRLTYAELDRHAGALAAELLARHPGAGPDACVALYLEASVEHVVALLALARLNLTIVPLDPAYPPALLRQVLDQITPLCVLVAPGADPDVGDLPRHPVTLAGPAGPPPPRSFAGRPLYTLFTSGSTGTPKGVRVSDRILVNLLRWQAAEGGLAPAAVTQQFSMLSFDVSFQEIFGTLCGGGCLHLVRPGWRQDLPALLDQLDTAGVERIFMPYVALQLLAENGVRTGRYPGRLRDVVTAGEQLLCTDAIRGWFAGLPGARLHNHYGPSETHVVSALRLDGDPADWPERPAIGRPVANAWLRVVDEAGVPAPPGHPGDLLLGGPLVDRCYLGDPDLNATRFVAVPGAGLFFRSGDRAFADADGLFHFLGRDDDQVKVSGHRLELGQVEAALLRHPAVAAAVVLRDGGELVACLRCPGGAPAVADLVAHLAGLLPTYARVDRFRVLPALPRTASGKVDRRAALAVPGVDLRPRPVAVPASSAREARLAELFAAVVGRPIGPDERFFDAGATSLDLMRFHLRCAAEPGPAPSIPDLFEHVTIRRLSAFLDGLAPGPAPVPAAANDNDIAVVGMAVRVAGADDLAAFWELVSSGGRGIEFFPAADGLVGARSQLTGPLAFDPARFGIGRHEARLMDPQQRHLLMSCVEALAHAGLADPADPAGPRVGLVAACGENTYFQAMLRDGDPAALPDGFQLALHHDKDFLATKVAYHLDLTGPAFTVQSACSSSLVAVHVAAGLLRQGDAEVMLAGGVLVDPSLRDGYRYRPQHIFSVDGHCRPFSDDATGTIGASGVGVVVLKPLRAARRDGDTVYAVLTGSAVNNDGAGKLGYSAPSLAGQRAVIRAALARSGRSAADLGYVEAHGTGTELGDPVEVGALRQAFDLPDDAGHAGRCALASVKSQIGHLGAAAGVVGLVRAALAVHHGVVPPNVDFRRLNPRIGADLGPFHIPTVAYPWPADRPRVAAVSSFGIGGTNAHVILEAATGPRPRTSGTEPVLAISGTTATATRADAGRIGAYLAAHPEAYPAVLRHLQAGRPQHRWRLAAVCAGPAAAVAWLSSAAASAVAVVPTRTVRAAGDGSPAALVDAWLGGDTIGWAPGPAPAPWNFPPPAFDLTDHDVPRRAPAAPDDGWPARLPEDGWLHQPHWVRRHRATVGGPVDGTLVLVTDGPEPVVDPRHARVVRVAAAGGFARLGDDRFTVDPADPDSVRELVDALGDPGPAGLDWVHALPLSITGAVGADTLARAYRACVDTAAALLRAGPARHPMRIWWLSYDAQPVDGTVGRPESGLLAGACEVAAQEYGVDSRWLDLAHPAAAFALPPAGPRRLALRDGYWWEPALLPVHPLPAAPAATGPASYLLLGGTGGIGASVAAWLLARSDCRVILLARHPRLPDALAPWADRVELMAADLAARAPDDLLAELGRRTARLDGVIHAAGVAAGTTIARRDPVAGRAGTAGKINGALLVELLIARYRPAFAVYCSSMAAWFGGVGQLDYAAANGLLDGFARHRAAGDTARIGVNWDVWREAGMARDVLAADARHRAHLATGLTVAEGQRMFAQALALRLPQLLVTTTALAETPRFYGAPPPDPEAVPATPVAPVADAAGQLTRYLCHWLGIADLDPTESLYDLGADSLILLDLVGEVKERFGVNLSLARFSHRVSLAEVLALLSEAQAADRPVAGAVPVQVWQAGTGRDVLCLIHPVGGDIQAYRSLVAELDPALTVCLIADPGLDSGAPVGWSLAERAWRYHAAVQARFPRDGWRWRLGGWSFGAWVALAMAAEAETAGRPVAALYLLDPPPPDAGPRLASYAGPQLATVFANELGGAADSTARDYADRLARCCRANLASMAAYRVPHLAGTPTRLWLATRPTDGLPEPDPPGEQWERWRAHLPADAVRADLDTTHYGLVRPPAIRAVAAAITTAHTEDADGNR